jgi:hypothetical protein
MRTISTVTASGTQPIPAIAPRPLFQAMHTTLDAQVAAGDASMGRYLAAHGARDDRAFDTFVLGQLTGPPQSSAPELAAMRELQQTRTTADTAAATFLDQQGDSSMWQNLLRAWQSTVAPDQAARGARLLRDAWQIADQATGEAKHGYQRERPFAQDASLHPILVSPVNPHGSYPSQHVTNSYAAAALLSVLMPDRAAEFAADAEQVAFARVYSNVHFPSDAAASALIGRMAADYVVRFD